MKYDLSKDSDRVKFFKYISTLEKKNTKVELKEIKPTRSLSQNNYIHALFGIYANDRGYFIEEAKTVLKRKLGYFYEKNGIKFLTQTSKMDSKQLSSFSEELRILLNEEGLNAPTPEMFRLMQYEIENDIEKNKFS